MILTGVRLLSQLIGAREGKPHRSQLMLVMRCLLMTRLLNKLNLRQAPGQIWHRCCTVPISLLPPDPACLVPMPLEPVQWPPKPVEVCSMMMKKITLCQTLRIQLKLPRRRKNNPKVGCLETKRKKISAWREVSNLQRKSLDSLEMMMMRMTLLSPKSWLQQH